MDEINTRFRVYILIIWMKNLQLLHNERGVLLVHIDLIHFQNQHLLCVNDVVLVKLLTHMRKCKRSWSNWW